MSTASGTVEPLNGAQKAAAIMLALSEEDGARVLEFLDPGEIRTLSIAMAGIGTVPAESMETLMSDFGAAVSSLSSVAGGLERAEAVLSRALPAEQAKSIIDEIRRPSRGIWKKLATVDRSLLAGYLRSEHPQTVALILSQLESETTSRILAGLPQPLAIDVINRMLKLQPVQKDVMEQIEKNLEQDLLSPSSARKKADSHVTLAEIFNSLDKSAEARLMEALEQVNAPSSKRIRQLMFTFEDLLRLEAAAMQTVIRLIDKNVLTKALFGQSELVSNAFLSNMSTRAAKVLADDVAALQNLKQTDVEAAQGELIRLAKGLIDRGEIANPKRSSEDEDEDLG